MEEANAMTELTDTEELRLLKKYLDQSLEVAFVLVNGKQFMLRTSDFGNVRIALTRNCEPLFGVGLKPLPRKPEELRKLLLDTGDEIGRTLKKEFRKIYRLGYSKKPFPTTLKKNALPNYSFSRVWLPFIEDGKAEFLILLDAVSDEMSGNRFELRFESVKSFFWKNIVIMEKIPFGEGFYEKTVKLTAKIISNYSACGYINMDKTFQKLHQDIRDAIVELER